MWIHGNPGYIGVKAIYKVLEIEMPETKLIYTDYKGGDLTKLCGFESNYKAADVSYKPEIVVEGDSRSTWYLELFRSNAETDKSLVMVTDSFKDSCKGYLAKDFTRTTVVHRSELNNKIASEELEKLGNGDVLLLLAVERLDDENVDAAEKVTEIIKR